MIQHLNKLFIVIVVLSIFTYFERPDYNLPLFGFILVLWENAYVNQKQRMWYLMAISLVVDLIWIIYWAVLWSSYENKQSGLANFTIVISVIILFLKLGILVITILKVQECKGVITNLWPNMKGIVKGPSENVESYEAVRS